MPPQIYYRSEVIPKKFSKTCWYRLNNFRTTLPSRSEFEYERLLGKAIHYTKLETSKIKPIPDAEWWKKLCKHVQTKHPQYSKYGAKLMEDKLIRAMGGRMLFENLYEENQAEIERFMVRAPVFIIGLPRCNGANANHMYARSGLFTGLRTADTMFPAFPAQNERRGLAHKLLKDLPQTMPQLQAVTPLRAELPDSDVALQLFCPKSLAWGLLHGLPEYLYETMHEDQEHMFDFENRCLKVFQWYRQCDEFSDCVTSQVKEILIPELMMRDGRKMKVENPPWMIHSPFALLHIEALHKVFPDMKLIWCHRALSQCVGSTCAALSIHNAIYTGTSPTQSQLSALGEMVVGLFGSGSENAIDYLAKFPMDRMVHWSSRDIARSGSRLVTKTIEAFNMESDRFYNQQIIDGQVERTGFFRPRLDHELAYFGLHEGVIGEHFQVYTNQFEEYAYEPKFGVKIQDYLFMGGEYAKQRFAIGANHNRLKKQETSFAAFSSPGQMMRGDHHGTVAGGGYRAIGPHD